MGTRQAKIEMYWVKFDERSPNGYDHHVNWRLVGANCEVMCQSTQGFRDKGDAVRSISSVIHALTGDATYAAENLKFVGPGRKPSATVREKASGLGSFECSIDMPNTAAALKGKK